MSGMTAPAGVSNGSGWQRATARTLRSAAGTLAARPATPLSTQKPAGGAR